MKENEMIVILILLFVCVGFAFWINKLENEYNKFKKDSYEAFGAILTRLDKIESQKYLIKEK